MKSVQPPRKVRCRYRRANDEMCSNEALDAEPGAEIVLCLTHAERAVRMLTELRTAIFDGTRT